MDTEYTKGFKAGLSYEQERIIKLLHEKAAVNWIEALEYPYYAEQLEELIKGEN